ncbi:hypothetical protein RB620_01940 [Paenibacillus sp. LHD-117]|uniref:hypothetical protein n=1 Tax=Paenibacillus sp. LHD-117 TaxID=3071412 RepID=UPI0027DF2A2F|nr:hypothetical protein [Paenibacillus sp. LHD-117]MDQ6418188.1 hypothetical protein [Paenibacillus sp. LHD-117]
MRKPRVLPLAITVVATAVLLFGGFAMYKQFAVAAPLTEKLEAMPGVLEASKPEIGQKEMNVKLQLSNDANLRELYGEASKEASNAAGSRKVTLEVAGDSDKALEQLWYSAMFDVAEAMETKAYSDIPEAMNKAVAGSEGVTAVTEMDESNVYITIRSEQASKYIVLPRIANKLEVW